MWSSWSAPNPTQFPGVKKYLAQYKLPLNLLSKVMMMTMSLLIYTVLGWKVRATQKQAEKKATWPIGKAPKG